MSQLMDVLQFNVWDYQSFDNIYQESDFWSQLEYESESLDSNTTLNVVQENEADWSISERQEEHKDNIVHHDCMWPGIRTPDTVQPNTFVPTDLMGINEPDQSVLCQDMPIPRPDTPPGLDGDEHPQFRHVVDVTGAALRILRDTRAVAADHSYTARQHMDCLGVQTPSDSGESEEEIDVVSLGTTSTYEPLAATCQVSTDEHTRVSSAPERLTQPPVEVNVTPRPVARKRLVPPTGVVSAVPRRRRGPGRRGRSNTDTDSEAESPEIERRSIHNDMERLRRIGLKNLFDELKMQIPATRDKERAPKVVILREAAALCRKIRDEELERDHLKKQQQKLMAKLKKLRIMHSGHRHRPY